MSTRDGYFARRATEDDEDFDESGRLYLELCDGTPVEAARGMALLMKLVG